MRGPVNFAVSRPTIRLSQGTVVVGAILAAWVLWLAVNNRLVVYWQIMTGQGGATTSGTTTNSTSSPATTTGGSQPSLGNPFSWNDLPWPLGSGTGAAGSGGGTVGVQ